MTEVPESTAAEDAPPTLERARAVGRADEALLTNIYEERRAEVFAFLIRMTRDREAAEDLLQDTFIRLIREARAGRMPDQVRPWLYRVAANAAISRSRGGAAWHRLLPRLVDRKEPKRPDDEALRVERDRDLYAALADLAPAARAALVLAGPGLRWPGDRRLDRPYRWCHPDADVSLAGPAAPSTRSHSRSAMNALERHVHDRASELAASAIDFALTSAETIELEAHLFDCPQCARDAAGLRADAMAIRAPVALLPSRRVDDAVYREIARDGARPQRFLLLAAAALLLLAMLGVVAVGAALLRTQDTGPITVVPTAPVVVVSPAEPVASSIDPVVLLRVELFGDLPVGRWPSLTVFRDGTVLRWDGSGQRITRLTPVGLELLLAPVTDSDLLVRSGRIGTDLTGPAHGFASYTIVFRRGQEIVHRSASDPPTPANRAEAERIIALAEHLDDLESWLPADAWAIGPASATPYVPSDYLLKVTVFENQPGVDYPPLALDVGAFHWPLEGRLDNFGEALTEPPLGAGSVSRCGLLTLAEATAVLRALAAAPLVQEAERMVANLAWAFANSRITVSLAPLLPDDPRECAVDRNWP